MQSDRRFLWAGLLLFLSLPLTPIGCIAATRFAPAWLSHEDGQAAIALAFVMFACIFQVLFPVSTIWPKE